MRYITDMKQTIDFRKSGNHKKRQLVCSHVMGRYAGLGGRADISAANINAANINAADNLDEQMPPDASELTRDA